MLTYSHPNSRVEAPSLTPEQDQLYLAIINGTSAPPGRRHRRHVAADLEMVAERLRCDDFAAQLENYGVEARCVDRRTDDIHYVPAYLCLSVPGHLMLAVDSEFGRRLLDRLANLPVAEAVARTYADAEKPTYTDAELTRLEQEADAHCRRVLSQSR